MSKIDKIKVKETFDDTDGDWWTSNSKEIFEEVGKHDQLGKLEMLRIKINEIIDNLDE